MKSYSKIFKYVMWILIVISFGLVVFGFTKGFPASVASEDNGTVSSLLNWAYILFFAAIVITVNFGIGVSVKNNPKSLVKLLVGLVIVAVICGGAYLLAGGKPLVGYMGPEKSQQTLKLTDTILNLTYLFGILAIAAILVGEFVMSSRSK